MGNSITPTKRRIVYDESSGHCIYCGHLISLKQLSVDHIIPRSNGGTDSLENLICSCRICNNNKNDLSISQYIKTLPENKQRKYYRRIDAMLFSDIINAEKADRLLGKVSIEPERFHIKVKFGRINFSGSFSLIRSPLSWGEVAKEKLIRILPVFNRI